MPVWLKAAGTATALGKLLGKLRKKPDKPHRPKACKTCNTAKDGRIRTDLDQRWIDNDGNLKWPPNNGASGPETKTLLQRGTTIDRYGSPQGNFGSPVGTPFQQRSLPYDQSKIPYTRYEVIRPIETHSSQIAPWFGQAGGGTQYRMNSSFADLVRSGYLRPLP
jgi:hypothetical protein